MTRTIASTVALVFALSLVGAAQEPPKPETKDPKKSTSADPQALKAVQEGVAKSMKKKYTFKGSMDVEVGGSPMMAIQLNGEHAGKWMHVKTEIMGNPVEAYSDGTMTIAKDARSGKWQKQEGDAGSGVRGGLGMDQVSKAVKSARFDGEAKVGSHDCKIIRAKVNAEELKKALGGRGAAGQGTVKKSSLKFYVDKKDGRLRRMKLTMDAEGNMGGQKMAFQIIAGYRYTYGKDVKVELPAEVKAVLEEKPQEPPPVKKDEPKDDGGGKDEGSGGKK